MPYKQALETQKAAIAAGNFPLTEAVGRHTHTQIWNDIGILSQSLRNESI